MKWISVVTTIAFAALASGQPVRTRDSAGVRIIENPPRLTAPVAFELGKMPTFDVGGLQQNPADEFSNRNGYYKAVRSSNGNVIILDRTRVLFFDAAGKRLKAFGREGQGPGEFEQATDVCVTRGDTVLVGQYRKPITKLTKDGELVALIPLPDGSLTEGDICFDDGTFVVMSRAPSPSGAPLVYRFIRSGPEGAVNTLLDYQYPPFDMLVQMENPKAARGKRMYFARGTDFEIKAYDRSGKLSEIIRTADALVPLTDAQKMKLPLMAFRMGSSPAEREEAHRRAIAGSTTKFWPTVGAMHIDLSNRIWVEDSQLERDITKPVGWTAFDSTGRLLGRLIIPGAASKEAKRFVVSFGRNEVIFHRLDDDGAIHYTAYPILPARKDVRSSSSR